MYRRYIIIGLVLFLLIGAYFAFFDKEDENKEYLKHYNKLVDRENYDSDILGVQISIDEFENEGKYSYIVTFDNVNEIKNNVKILVASGNANKDSKEYFPNFGIIDNEGYSIVPKGTTLKDKQVEGINLAMVEEEKIEYLLIFFYSNNIEQFVKVKVSNYLS